MTTADGVPHRTVPIGIFPKHGYCMQLKNRSMCDKLERSSHRLDTRGGCLAIRPELTRLPLLRWL